MFKLVSERTAWWPVTWAGVAEDGSVIEHRIELKFRVVGRDDFRDLFGEALGAGVAEEPGDDVLAADMALARRVVAEDWKGVGDEKGAALPFSWDRFAQLMDAPMFAPSFAMAYVRLYQALPEVREKNSAASRAPGPAAAVGATQAQSPKSLNRGARRRAKSKG